MSNYQTSVMKLIDRYDQAIDYGHIACYLPGNKSFGDLLDYTKCKNFQSQLEKKIEWFEYKSPIVYQLMVYKATFDILDDAEMINGDMRTIYEKEFC
jgi:hypothetical protein